MLNTYIKAISQPISQTAENLESWLEFEQSDSRASLPGLLQSLLFTDADARRMVFADVWLKAVLHKVSSSQ